MNMSRYYIDRSVYTVLDYIGDVGGLQAALMIVFGIFFMFCTVNAFENYLVSQLFRAEKPDGTRWTDAFTYKDTG